ncbi:MAG: glycosyltransferase 61 family protein [Alphaproteobacteria bacterium]|nr:glycosyltransferase 61 family protein [Alphaproteobacteria bacterium]
MLTQKFKSMCFICMFTLFSTHLAFCVEIQNRREYISLDELSQSNAKILEVFVENNSSQNVLELKDGVVLNEGIILTSDGKTLKDVQTSLRPQSAVFKDNFDINNEELIVHFKGRLVSISSPGSENWYHWLLQILSRLYIVQESKISFDKIYINNCQAPWQISSLNIVLEKLGIPKNKILTINNDTTVVKADTLIIPSIPFIPCKGPKVRLPEWLKKKLNETFLDSSKATIAPFERIYISRSKAKSRKITNESNLIDQLEQHNFKVIFLEDLSPFDQAHIFNNAKIIVGPHGSGFTNLIFSKQKTKIIEIDHGSINEDEQRSFFKRLSTLMGCDYHPFYVDKTSEDHFEDDMIVNIPQFIEYINQVISNS